MQKSKSSSKLLDINHQLHEAMGSLQSAKKVEGGIASLPSPVFNNILTLGIEAEKITKKDAPAAPELSDKTGIPALLSLIHKMAAVYPVDNELIKMPVEVASQFISLVANHLTNQVHNVAMSFIKSTGKLHACTLTGDIDSSEALTVSRYCSGVLPKTTNEIVVITEPLKKATIKGKLQIINYPTLISQRLGYHRVKVSTSTTDNDVAVAIQYKESGPSYKASLYRQEGVYNRLTKEGLDCNVGKQANTPFGKDLLMYCSGTLPQGKMRQLAAFFSLLRDADISGYGKDVIPMVSDKTWEIAGDLVATHGENTWESGQGILGWGTVNKQWKEDKDVYSKEAIYTDLRGLAMLRDEHHQIEHKYGVDKGKFSKEGGQKVIANALKAVAIIEKNDWDDKGTKDALSALQGAISEGKTKIEHLSDIVGHSMHLAVNKRLQAEGQYGGCTIKGQSIHNISAANLAYCEGVLNGTSTGFDDAGNTIVHSVSPKTYSVHIGDPADGYDMVIHLPGDDVWNSIIKHGLYDFDCKGNVCKRHFTSLHDIRDIALIMSNLKGAGEGIGEECGKKAIAEALQKTITQKAKGVFSFTQKPMIDNKKGWIDLCHEKYNIMPPGLTDVEKELLSLIGKDKTHGGCSFDPEIIPNKGIISYCKGVRPNPLSKVSAHFTANGKLGHYFHEKMDKLAVVDIQPTSTDLSQVFPALLDYHTVELSNIDMRSDKVQQEVIDRLQSKFDMKCSDTKTCNGSLCEHRLQQLAAFLSSLHHTHKLSADCIPHAVDYAISMAQHKPIKELAASLVYPWTQAEWGTEVCGKISAKPETVPTTEKDGEKITKAYLNTLAATKGKPPFDVGGCVSDVSKNPTKIMAGYCGGVLDRYIKVKGGEKEVNAFQKDLAVLSSQGGTHRIAPIYTVEFDSKWNSFSIAMSQQIASIPEIVDVLTNHYDYTQDGNTFTTTHATPIHASRIALFFSHLHNITELPKDCRPAAVAHALAQAKKLVRNPIYPFHQHDWLEDVCTKAEQKLSPDELKTLVLDFFKKQSPGEWIPDKNIVNELTATVGIIPTELLSALYKLHADNKLAFDGNFSYQLVNQAHIAKTTIEFPSAEKPSIPDVAQAIAMIKEGTPYAGCHPDKPGVVLTPAQIAYCEGIQTPSGKKKAGYVQHGEEYGEAIALIGHHGNGYHTRITGTDTIKLRYSEDDKSGKEWYKRMVTVGELLGDMGYACASKTSHTVTCIIPKDNPEVLRTTALFLSKLHNIDRLPTGCVDDAVRRAMRQANIESPQPAPWKFNIYPYTVDEWDKEVCKKRELKPIRVDAATLVKQLGTAGLLKAAHELGVSPAGSDAVVAKKLLEAGYET